MTIDPQNLPGDLAGCHALIAELVRELDVRDRRLRQMQHQLEELLRWRYGQKSERIDENQLFFAALTAIQAESPRPAATEPPSAAPARSAPRPGHGRTPLPRNLPRRRVVFDLPAEQQHCPHCAAVLRHIGEEVSERLEFIPASLTVLEEACPRVSGLGL